MANTWQFFLKSKEFGLAGVEKLCWEGLAINICDVLCVKIGTQPLSYSDVSLIIAI